TGSCSGGFSVCGGGVNGGGACKDLANDAANCATCSHTCTAPGNGGTATCVTSVCTGSCGRGLTVCGAGADGGGSCFNLTSDGNHCGTCNNVCTTYGICSASVCLYGPSGVQTSIPVASLTGWSQCYLDTYSVTMSTNTVLTACTKAR